MNLVEVKNLFMSYKSDDDVFLGERVEQLVLKDVSLSIERGKVLGLVGESGCGKSTLGRTILALEKIKSGRILFEGNDISTFDKAKMKYFRQNAQLIFQNPLASLNPRMSIYETLCEPLKVHNICEKKYFSDKVDEMLSLVELKPEDKFKYPHEFSGGQNQRIAIARALITNPEFIVADEPVSALDVSIQAQIINLLMELKEKFNLTLLFISHDLNIVRYLSDDVVIMHHGKIVESGTVNEIFNNPQNDYTKKLLSAVLNIN